jgi:uncharacterized phage protein gp47/JayE
MPFTRPSLSDLRSQVAQDIASAAPGSDPLLRFSNLKITGDAQAALANLHYGYLDWIAKNAVPFTASGEFLEGWAGLIGVIRKPATSASGSVTFIGTPGAVIPAGVKVVRGDGVTFTTGAGQTVGGGGTAIVAATADADLTGQTGAFGNTAVSTVMTLGQAIAGVQSNGSVSAVFAGGADLETDDALRSRMLFVYQNPPQGGDKNDYVQWALAVPGVTRAWCFPNLAGPGTVSVYTMWDVSEAAHGGFPQGSNGVATAETRAAAATGDQLAVANALFALQPVTALVYHNQRHSCCIACRNPWRHRWRVPERRRAGRLDPAGPYLVGDRCRLRRERLHHHVARSRHHQRRRCAPDRRRHYLYLAHVSSSI